MREVTVTTVLLKDPRRVRQEFMDALDQGSPGIMADCERQLNNDVGSHVTIGNVGLANLLLTCTRVWFLEGLNSHTLSEAALRSNNYFRAATRSRYNQPCHRANEVIKQFLKG